MKKIFLLTLLSLPSLSWALEVLYIGDSHSHVSTQAPELTSRRFGHIFVQSLSDRGHEISYFAACGSSPQSWVHGDSTTCGYTSWLKDVFRSSVQASFPGISSLYDRHLPEKIMINLGDNMFDWKSVGTKRQAFISSRTVQNNVLPFLSKLPNLTPENCLWIGPTYHIEGRLYKKSDSVVDELYSQLQASLADKCRLIDSRPMVLTVEPTDGLHHTNADSQAWANGVLEKL